MVNFTRAEAVSAFIRPSDNQLTDLTFPPSFHTPQRTVCFPYIVVNIALILILSPPAGTIRLWQTTPGKTYGLWQGNAQNGG